MEDCIYVEENEQSDSKAPKSDKNGLERPKISDPTDHI
jgi:hypothetical protein